MTEGSATSRVARAPRRGRRLGDRRVHVERPEARYFRYGGEGTMVAKAAAIEPASTVE